MIIAYKILTTKRKTPFLTYFFEKNDSYKNLSKGQIVQIPFRNEKIIGIVIEEDKKPNIDSKKIKYISHIYDLPLILNDNFLHFLEKISEYYMSDLSSIAKMVLPINLKISIKSKDKKIFEKISNFSLPTLSDEQQILYNNIENEVNNEKSGVFLLKGVTGSGKTEIYFHKIAKILSEQKQVLILLPEIGLTTQIVSRFKKTFGFAPAIWHSGISSSKKQKIFEGVVTGEEKIIIGARSSLFLPYKNLGLIIIDEEHDSSYKQEEGILYNARDAAILRGYFENFLVLLVSATPSIETMNNVLTGKYKIFELNSRFGTGIMPKMKIVDRRNSKKNSWISEDLKQATLNAISEKYQVLFFLNRKGYAPLLICGSCGFRFMCNNCSSWLVVHSIKPKLMCHHCGHDEVLPKSCTECGEENLVACGPGVERVAKEASEIFKSAKIQIVTKEELSSQEKIENLIRSIENGEIDIIIGTQIITKGYHFPKLKIVGIIDADLGISKIDLKASERSFQILQQVSGRAGREIDNGEVYIQTFMPENPIIKALADNNEEKFYQEEFDFRKKENFPPFTRVAAILLTGKNSEITLKNAQILVKSAPKDKRVLILGPAQASLSKLKGAYRFRIIVITEKTINIQKYINSWINNVKFTSSISIKIDIDPYSFY